MGSSSKLAKFAKVFGKRRKAQFFILTGFAMVTVFYFISQWLEPFTIIDTSQVPLMDEVFIFNNIKEKTKTVVSDSKTCADLTYNLEEYRNYVVNYAFSKGYRLDFNYLPTPCNPNFPVPLYYVRINMTLQSPRATLTSIFAYQWPYPLTAYLGLRQSYNNLANIIIGDKQTPAINENIQSIAFDFQTAGTPNCRVVYGVYSDNAGPSQLLGQTNEATCDTTGYVSASMITPVFETAGHTYWIVALFNNDASELQWVGSGSGTNEFWAAGQTYSPILPGTFPVGALSDNNIRSVSYTYTI